MKIVLVGINAKYIHTNLAVRSLQANAGKYRNEVEIAEYTINHSIQEILSDLFDREPDVVGFSCYLWNIEYVMRLAQDWKKIWPQGKIVVGGPEVSYNPEKTFEQYPFVDLLIRGEGEYTFKEVLAWLHGEKQSRAELSGVAYLEEGELHIGPPQKAMDMDDLVFPYESLEGLENKILYYESIRGCPFSCSYCLSSIERSVRIKSVEKTEKELDFFIERKVPQVKLVDRTFNCNRDYAYEIWRYIGEHDNGVTNFHFEIGGDLLREKDFELLKTFRPGLVQFEIGVQSTNPDTIKAIRRTMDLKKLADCVARVHEAGNIHEHLDLIAGLPYEGYASFRHSFEDVYAMKPDQLQLGFLKVLEGSYMNEVKDSYDIQFSSYPPYEVLSTRWLPYEDLKRLKAVEEMVEVYYNSFQFSASMTYLRTLFSMAFDMYVALSMHYREKGYFCMKHSRIARYEILWEFAIEWLKMTPEQLEEFRQVLTFDLYSRDYVKNPPSFVELRSDEQKKKIRAFFDRECEDPQYLHGYDNRVTKQLFNMIYIGEFSFDLTAWQKKGEIVFGPFAWFMFDYQKRNPLNYSAGVQRISMDS